MSEVAKVSVITPVKNIFNNQKADNFLKCVSSVATQTYPSIEHFVVDGGSDDGTMVILTTQPTIHFEVFPTENKIEAMNFAVSKVQGDYILFLYADDYLNEDTAIEKMVRTLEENKADFAFCSAEKELPMGKKSLQNAEPECFFGHAPFLPQMCLLKKSLFDEFSNFDSSKDLSFFYDFILKVFLSGFYGAECKETLLTVFSLIFLPERIKKIQEENFKILDDVYKSFSAYTQEKVRNLVFLGLVPPDLYAQIMEKISPKMKDKLMTKFKTLVGQRDCWSDFVKKGFRKLYVPLQGIGDALTFQAITKNLYEQAGHKVLVAHKNKDLFENNPYVEVTDAAYDAPQALSDVRISKIEQAGLEIVFPCYYEIQKAENNKFDHFYPDCHLIARVAALCGINGKVDLKPIIFLTDEEKKYGRFAPKGKKQVAIMANAYEKVKFWPYFQDVIDALKDEYYFVQIGAKNDKKLNGVSKSLEGQITLRQTASVLYNSDLFVGEIGGLMHMARAVDCPAVIAYSGVEPDYFVNYIANTNVHPKKPCTEFRKGIKYSCGACLNCFTCVRSIDANDVVQAIREKLGKVKPDPLPVETAEVKSDFQPNSIQKFKERHQGYFDV